MRKFLVDIHHGQAPIGTLVDEIQNLQRTLQGKRREREVFDAWQRDGKLTDYTMSGKLTTIGPPSQTRTSRYARNGQKVMLFEQTGIEVTNAATTPLLDYFCWYCNVANEGMRGYPWETMRDDIPLPVSRSDIAIFLAEVATVRQERASTEAAVVAKKAEIEQAGSD